MSIIGNFDRQWMIKAPFVRRGLGGYDGWMLFESDRIRNIVWLTAGDTYVIGGPINLSGSIFPCASSSSRSRFSLFGRSLSWRRLSSARCQSTAACSSRW